MKMVEPRPVLQGGACPPRTLMPMEEFGTVDKGPGQVLQGLSPLHRAGTGILGNDLQLRVCRQARDRKSVVMGRGETPDGNLQILQKKHQLSQNSKDITSIRTITDGEANT